MSAHTAGPWETIQYIYDMHIVAVNSDGSEICIAEMQAGSMADALLIAAAPDLLDALEEARDGLRWFRNAYPHDAEVCGYEVMDQIDAAIAKATGED